MRLKPTKPLAGLVCASLMAAATLAHSPGHAANYPCFGDDAMQSARIHDLKVNLMVNALKCRKVNPMTLRSFGQLLERRSGEFASHEMAVKRSLEIRFGQRQAIAMFDDYETRIGNYHSGVQPSLAQCEDTAAFIRLAGRADSGELETLSRLVTNRGIRSCPVERAASPPPLQRFEREPFEMVDGIPTYSTPGTGPSSDPEPLERVAIPEAAAPVISEPAPRIAAAAPAGPGGEPGTADRETRLAEAITALDAAAAALRGMQTGARAPGK